MNYCCPKFIEGLNKGYIVITEDNTQCWLKTFDSYNKEKDLYQFKMIRILFCPFCGKRLETEKQRWIRERENIGQE